MATGGLYELEPPIIQNHTPDAGDAEIWVDLDTKDLYFADDTGVKHNLTDLWPKQLVCDFIATQTTETIPARKQLIVSTQFEIEEDAVLDLQGRLDII